MPVKNPNGNNVLPFRRAAAASPAATATMELKELLGIYDRLIELLRQTYDEGLDTLADSIVRSVVACRAALEAGFDDSNTGQALVKEMREGLRQIPGTLRSLLPGIGPRLGESMERKLGIQFSSYQ